jgi:hypothetical protein
MPKAYVVGVGMTQFLKPRGLVDYPGKYNRSYL